MPVGRRAIPSLVCQEEGQGLLHEYLTRGMHQGAWPVAVALKGHSPHTDRDNKSVHGGRHEPEPD